MWDVGHQSYAYKILTERNDRFDTLRQLNGISGFNNIFESEYDAFGVGHASTSISAALGITVANLMPRQSKGTFKLVEKFSPPIYIAFFVLAGAHMEFGKLGAWIIIMILVYTLSRAVGKMSGCWFGALGTVNWNLGIWSRRGRRSHSPLRPRQR